MILQRERQRQRDTERMQREEALRLNRERERLRLDLFCFPFSVFKSLFDTLLDFQCIVLLIKFAGWMDACMDALPLCPCRHYRCCIDISFRDHLFIGICHGFVA